jgi:mannosyltransferase OCH1-like enzyme
MEKIIHQIWIGPYELSDKEKIWTNNIKESHPDFEYIFWNNHNFPKLPDELEEIKDQYQQNQEWVKIADMVRYYVIYKYGGLYIDADYELLKPIHDLEIDRCDGFLPLHFTMGKYENPKHGETICNSIFGFKKSHPILEHVCNNISNNSHWLGPHFFGKYVKSYLGLDEYSTDETVAFEFSKINVKTIHSREELKREYLFHHYSYNWHPDNQKKLRIDENFQKL